VNNKGCKEKNGQEQIVGRQKQPVAAEGEMFFFKPISRVAPHGGGPEGANG